MRYACVCSNSSYVQNSHFPWTTSTGRSRYSIVRRADAETLEEATNRLTFFTALCSLSSRLIERVDALYTWIGRWRVFPLCFLEAARCNVFYVKVLALASARQGWLRDNGGWIRKFIESIKFVSPIRWGGLGFLGPTGYSAPWTYNSIWTEHSHVLTRENPVPAKLERNGESVLMEE